MRDDSARLTVSWGLVPRHILTWQHVRSGSYVGAPPLHQPPGDMQATSANQLPAQPSPGANQLPARAPARGAKYTTGGRQMSCAPSDVIMAVRDVTGAVTSPGGRPGDESSAGDTSARPAADTMGDVSQTITEPATKQTQLSHGRTGGSPNMVR